MTGPRSAGTNALLHDGAAVVRDVRDALDAHRHRRPGVASGARCRGRAPREPARPAAPPPPADPELRRALEAVDDGATSPGRLARVFDGDVARASVALTRLELAGLLRRDLDGSYARRAGT